MSKFGYKICIILTVAVITMVPSFAFAKTSFVDVLWETGTYTPPFYQGKALKYGPATIKFVAIPEIYSEGGARMNDTFLYYKWSLNGRVLGTISGINKKTVSIATSLRNDAVSVQVLSPDQSKHYASGKTIITNTAPEILIYEKDPLLGVLFNTIPDGSRARSELSLVAYPLYFDVSHNNSGSLEYRWYVDGDVARASVGGSDITLNRLGEIGSSLIRLEIDNMTNVFQRAQYSMRVLLGNNKN